MTVLAVSLVIASILGSFIISVGAIAAIREYFRGKEQLLDKLQKAVQTPVTATEFPRDLRKGFN